MLSSSAGPIANVGPIQHVAVRQKAFKLPSRPPEVAIFHALHCLLNKADNELAQISNMDGAPTALARPNLERSTTLQRFSGKVGKLDAPLINRATTRPIDHGRYDDSSLNVRSSCSHVQHIVIDLAIRILLDESFQSLNIQKIIPDNIATCARDSSLIRHLRRGHNTSSGYLYPVRGAGIFGFGRETPMDRFYALEVS
ncbi:unnamed protein product [Clonostachys solani]|uniref:Uncharacterized protein n=1 Tax=Clonostachys solani TaxID=160281 RepID=A0A9N9ZLA5_9HYPO|nr:unnamed protein product [Clonostachys solani]